MRKNIVPALIAVSLSIAATPAWAETETVSIAVHYGDLNLSTPSGMATLERRIARAAARICGRSEVRPLFKALAHDRCIEETVDSARSEIARITRNIPTVALNR